MRFQKIKCKARTSHIDKGTLFLACQLDEDFVYDLANLDDRDDFSFEADVEIDLEGALIVPTEVWFEDADSSYPWYVKRWDLIEKDHKVVVLHPDDFDIKFEMTIDELRSKYTEALNGYTW